MYTNKQRGVKIMEQSKVVMISGASKGLGRAIALAFARQGASLAICARGEQALTEVKNEIQHLGVEVLAVTADINNTRDVERFVALAEEKFRKIDVLINNASTLGPSPIPKLLDTTEDDFFHVLRVNTASVFLLSKRVIPGMLQRNHGSVINITSEAGNTGYSGWGAYGISKFAVEGITQTWADELKETPIRVNMVDPGEMDTEMHDLAVPNCKYELAQPEDCTDVFLYLASDDASNIHGERLEAQTFDFAKGGE